MSSYTPAELESIAAAIGVSMEAVQARVAQFEDAAEWYRSALGQGTEDARLLAAKKRAVRAGRTFIPELPPIEKKTPSAASKTMEQLAQSCRRHLKNLKAGTAPKKEASLRKLLAHLSIEDPSAAEDGPGDPDILHLLTFAEDSDEDHVLSVIQNVVGGTEAEQVTATKELERLAREAAAETVEIGKETVPKGHHGDQAVNGWVDDMLVLYEAITGEAPGTSVGAPLRKNEGVPGGPLIRFLEAAGKPLAIQFTAKSWRSRIRMIVDGRAGQN